MYIVIQWLYLTKFYYEYLCFISRSKHSSYCRYLFLQIKSFAKWSKSNCIIKDLIKSIPKMPYYSWTKESRTLYKKIKKYKCEKYDDILERYWKSVAKFQGIKGQNYDCNKFSNNKAIIMLSLKYPQFNLGFSWIIRLRYSYKYNTTTFAIRMGRVSEDCLKTCPCCGEGNQSFEYWIFKCDTPTSFRWNSLNFIDDQSIYHNGF